MRLGDIPRRRQMYAPVEPGQALVACLTCGAVVADPEAHDGWHVRFTLVESHAVSASGRTL